MITSAHQERMHGELSAILAKINAVTGRSTALRWKDTAPSSRHTAQTRYVSLTARAARRFRST